MRSNTNKELTAIVTKLKIPPPLPGVKVFEEPCNGWVMPVPVRASSGHYIKVKLDPRMMLLMMMMMMMMMMRRLGPQNTAKFQGAYQVTSPKNLLSILKNGLVPGGEKGKRLMSFFGVFPPWDERNKVTRTRSPIPGGFYMLIVYIPPTDLQELKDDLRTLSAKDVIDTNQAHELQQSWYCTGSLLANITQAAW